MRNLKTHKTLLIIIAQLVVTGLILGFFVVPSARDIMTLQRDIADKREQLENLRKSGKSYKTIIEDYEYIKSDLPQLEAVTLKRGQELEFITSIEESASETQLTHELIFDTTLLQGETNKDFQEIPITINLTGQFENMLVFLERIETKDYYLNITSLRLTPITTQNRIQGFVAPGTAPQTTPEITDSDLRIELTALSYWE